MTSPTGIYRRRRGRRPRRGFIPGVSKSPWAAAVPAVSIGVPLAWIRLNDSGSGVLDSSGNGHGGTYTGSPIQGVPSPMKGDADAGVTFDGSTQYALLDALGTLGSNALTSSFVTVLQTTNKSAIENVFGSLNASNGGIQMYMNREGFAGTLAPGRVEFAFTGTSSGLRADVVSPSPDPMDGRVHVISCVVTSSTTMEVKIDGVVQALTYWATGLATPTNLGQGMVLGGSRFGGFTPTATFSGTIFEWVAWASRLTGTDTDNLWTAAGLPVYSTASASGHTVSSGQKNASGASAATASARATSTDRKGKPSSTAVSVIATATTVGTHTASKLSTATAVATATSSGRKGGLGASVTHTWARAGRAYRDAVLADGAALLWLMDDAGAVAADEAHLHPGAYVGAPTLGARGALAQGGAAVSLDGATQYVTSAYQPFASGSQRTFEGWFSLTDAAAWRVLFASTTHDAVGLEVDPAGSHLIKWWPDFAFTPVIWGGWPVFGPYVYVVLTYDDATGNAELFLNGASQGAQISAHLYPTALTYTFGVGADLEGDFWLGLVDGIAVYESILSAATIRDHYRLGLATGIGQKGTSYASATSATPNAVSSTRKTGRGAGTGSASCGVSASGRKGGLGASATSGIPHTVSTGVQGHAGASAATGKCASQASGRKGITSASSSSTIPHVAGAGTRATSHESGAQCAGRGTTLGTKAGLGASHTNAAGRAAIVSLHAGAHASSLSRAVVASSVGHKGGQGASSATAAGESAVTHIARKHVPAIITLTDSSTEVVLSG